MNPAWLISAGAGVAGLGAHGVFAARSGVFGRVVWRLPRGSGAAALTFDDGPMPGSTDAILNILRAAGVRATFFVIGRYAQQHPDLLRRAHAEGHLLANHTYDHSRLGLLHGWAYWRDQIERTNGVIAGVTGSVPRFFRPPMGFKAPPVFAAARSCGLEVVTWTRRPLDGVSSDPGRVAARVARARAGEIVLMHDGRDPASRRDPGVSVAALPRTLEAWRERGLETLRLDEALGGP